MRNPVLKVLLVLGSIFVVAIIAVFLVYRILPAGVPPPPLPKSNGYSAVVKAAHTIPEPPNDFRKMDHEQLQALVASNSAVLQSVRSNLDGEIQVPLEYSLDSVSSHLSDLSRFKRIAMAFLMESQLAQMEKRPADAAKSSLDTIRLGVACARGGILIDSLVGDAIDSMGTTDLQKLVDQLDQKSCKEIAQQLQNIDRQRQPWEQVLKQEHYWSSKAFPGARYLLVRLFTSRSTRASEAKAEQKFKTYQTNTRKLMIDLAARAYQLENGHPPASTADLVPNYLNTVPFDPFTGTNMTYLP